MTAEAQTADMIGWAIVELMGHRRLAGYVTERTVAGAAFLQLNIPSDPVITQLYAPSAVYAITPTSEETARQVAQLGRPAPVQRWELPAPELARLDESMGTDEIVDDWSEQ